MQHDPKVHTMDYDLVSKLGWFWIDCKFWTNCKKSNEENKLIICDQCDSTYHIHCLKPPLMEIPSTAWYCDSWDNCKGCRKKLVNKSKAAKFDVYRVWNKCYDAYQSEKYCKICERLFEENEMSICWDECDTWIHATCDSISKQQLDALQQSGAEYICPHCRAQNQ